MEIPAYSGYTRGGWNRNIAPASHYPAIFAGRNTHVARVLTEKNIPVSEQEANANLIQAAPALYEALWDALQSLKRLPNVPDAYRVTCIAQAEKALARANGIYVQDETGA